MNNHYLLFTEHGKFMGYTMNKVTAKLIVKQRNHFQKLFIEKFNTKMLNDENRSSIYRSNSEIIIYNKICIFEHENQTVYMNLMNHFMNTMDMINESLHQIDLIKFDDTEAIVIKDYMESISKYVNRMSRSFYESDFIKVSEMFLKVEDLILDLIYDLYKGGEHDNSLPNIF